ncbi:hypothetical protein C2E16_12190 [Mixta calida]|uniref:Uncharacterized protein n=1 Tax=Mixta calida TaxID=665913 RepID=A0ABM6S1K7_9GAMM|nr:hypothetical protein C2E16_12190 [Mixta calida]
MNSHDPQRIAKPLPRQYWRALAGSMQLHEKRCIKRAGVAGIALRAMGTNMYAQTNLTSQI